MLAILGLVIVTGVFAYQRFSGIVDRFAENTQPDMRLITSKVLLNHINDAELSVKSYRITGDTLYLGEFYNSVQSIDDALNKLHRITDEIRLTESLMNLDTLDSLIGQKVEILNDLLLLQDGFRTQKALDRVVNKMEESTIKETVLKEQKVVAANSGQEEEEKSNIFSRIFNRKKDKDGNEIGGDSVTYSLETIETNVVKLEDLNKEVNSVKYEETAYQLAYREKELEYILEDQIITKKITKHLQDFENSEMQRIANESESAEKQIQYTNQQILWFCVITGILILFMASIILSYVRNNKQYREALKKSKMKAEELAQVKQRFLANMSHEMRTPMNAIVGFSEQLAKGPLNDEQRNQLDLVLKSSNHLLYLINEVLDLSKLQANKIKLEHIGFRPHELFEDLHQFLSNDAGKKGLHTELHFTDELPNILKGDPFRLRQILFNIISNAIKFTNKGSIEIEVSYEVRKDKKLYLIFQVEDTGIGMDQEQLRLIFDEFEQAEVSTARQFGGTGLGLSIVKHLVDLHEGKIQVDSTLGEGTSIKIELPFEIGTPKDLPENNVKPTIVNTIDWNNKHVLLADDEKYNRLLLISILKKFNISYVEVSNGKEALDAVNEADFDLILMDIRMPEMDGIEASRQIRKLTGVKSEVPIIALTAASSTEDKEVYYEAGINGVLSKPYKEKELKEILSKHLKPKPMSTAINLNDLKSLSGDDVAFYQDMLATFLEGTKKGLQQLEEFVKKEDWYMMGEIAHKISSPCNHIGAEKLYLLVKKLEQMGRKKEGLEEVQSTFNEAKLEAQNVFSIVEQELNAVKAQ